MQLASAVVGAFRYAALNETKLEDLVAGLNATVSAVGSEEDFVTAVVVEVHPDELIFIGCGHHPPLVGRPGELESVSLPSGLPLEVEGSRRTAVRPWGEDELLVAYTDGLLEARDVRGKMLESTDWTRVIHTTEPATVVEELLGTVMAWTAHQLRDDVAVLVARRRGGAITGGTGGV